MLVHHILEKSVQRHPEKPAVWFANTWVTYGVLEEKSAKLAGFFHERGIQRGERIALLFENSIDYVVSYYAVLKAGAVVVSLNTELMTDTLKSILLHCSASGLIVSRKNIKKILPIFNQLPQLKFLVLEKKLSVEAAPDFPDTTVTLDAIYEAGALVPLPSRAIDIDLSSIIYTSGSTGEPKGVMLSHLNIVQNTRSITEYLQLSGHDRIMAVLPFHYVFGLTLLNTHFLVGGTVVIDNRFTFPNLVLETMKNQQVTGFAGVPSTFMILLNKTSIREYVPFEHLRYVSQAGGHMAVAIQKQVKEMFAPAKLVVMYGATELAPRLTWLPPDKWDEKKGSIGISIPNTEAFIADEEGNRLPPGAEGEIVARGSNVMMGYWKDPEGTTQVIRNGLYFTGDLGKADEDGFLFIVGRVKEMLKIGGNRVSAKEIEDAIIHLDGVLEAAVIGVPDPILGEAAKAFVVKKQGCESGEMSIKKALSRILPAYKIPGIIEFRDALPKNESGKIMKQQLKQEPKSQDSF